MTGLAIAFYSLILVAFIMLASIIPMVLFGVPKKYVENTFFAILFIMILSLLVSTAHMIYNVTIMESYYENQIR